MPSTIAIIIVLITIAIILIQCLTEHIMAGSGDVSRLVLIQRSQIIIIIISILKCSSLWSLASSSSPSPSSPLPPMLIIPPPSLPPPLPPLNDRPTEGSTKRRIDQRKRSTNRIINQRKKSTKKLDHPKKWSTNKQRDKAFLWCGLCMCNYVCALCIFWLNIPNI